MVFSSPTELNALYARLNAEFFAQSLPPCRIKWSRQLTRAAGNIDVKNRLIKLSVPLLIDAYAKENPKFEICGIVCDSPHIALIEIMKHEMIHLWLHERGLPSGHTAAFRAKARALGQTQIRHAIARPQPKAGWIYSCPRCNAEIVRRRRFGRPVACGKCCKIHSSGGFDARFQLKGRKIVSAPSVALIGSFAKALR